RSATRGARKARATTRCSANSSACRPRSVGGWRRRGSSDARCAGVSAAYAGDETRTNQNKRRKPMRRILATAFAAGLAAALAVAPSNAAEYEVSIAGAGPASLAYNLAAGLAENTNSKTEL